MKLLTYVLILMFYTVQSQNEQKDSIINLLENSKDTNKEALLYSELSKLYENENIDSAIYFAREGYNLSKSVNYKIAVAENSMNLGDYYVIKNNLDSAKTHYLRARKNFFETDSLYKYTINSMRLGNINLAQNNHPEALVLYQECLELSEENDFFDLIPHLYNNTGLLFKQIEDYEDAVTNFEKAYSLFKENKDEANYVYPLYNIALIESILGNDEDAIDRYLNLVSYHLKTENWISLAQIYNSISEIYLRNHEYNSSKEYLEMAISAIEDKKDSFNTGPTSLHKTAIYSNAAQLYFEQEKYSLAKHYARKSIKLSIENSYKLNIFKSAQILGKIYDNSKQLDSSLYYYKLYIDYYGQYQDEDDVKQLTKLKMQNEFNDILKKKEIDSIYQQASYKNRELKYIGLTVLAGLLAIILVLLFFNQKNKNSKLMLKEENLLLEKKKLNQDLEYKKKELTSNIMFLMEKNEFITSISKKLIELKPDAKKDNKELIQQIINEIKLNSTTKMWEEFELRFKEVHVRFYNQLNKEHPDLTLNEIKICAFLRLNMSSKDISAITHQSVKSINMARFRLRKKLDIDKDENLINYLNSL